MEAKEPLFLIEDGRYDKQLSEEFHIAADDKHLLVFVGGRDKAIKGLLICPDKNTDLAGFIDALKIYRDLK